MFALSVRLESNSLSRDYLDLTDLALRHVSWRFHGNSRFGQRDSRACCVCLILLSFALYKRATFEPFCFPDSVDLFLTEASLSRIVIVNAKILKSSNLLLRLNDSQGG